MESLLWLVNERRHGLLSNSVLSCGIRDSLSLVKRLTRTKVLEGHHGCVNSVCWNETGTKLLSGSDDCHLNIYDPVSGLMTHTFHTSHQSNIFSAKFLPQSGDCKTVSCAGIGSVEVSELTPCGDYIGHQFKCQSSITYQVSTTPGCPHEFLTCDEMGSVKLYDLRTCSSCLCEGNCNRSMLCRFPSAVTSMAVHPLDPHYLVVGLGDGTLRLLDRRRTDYWRDSSSETPLQVLHAAPLPLRYRPSAIRDRKLKITCVRFNANGTQLLASYSDDYVYLFSSGVHCGSDVTSTASGSSVDISRPCYLSQCERYPSRSFSKSHSTTSTIVGKPSVEMQEPLGKSHLAINPSPPRTGGPTSLRSERGRRRRRVPHTYKRIRLRGDWSDTGPESRPGGEESDHEEGGGRGGRGGGGGARGGRGRRGGGGGRGGAGGRGRGRGNLMNRMSRLFESWMDMALDSVSGSEGDDDEEEHEEEEEEEEERRLSSEELPEEQRAANFAESSSTPSDSPMESDSNSPTLASPSHGHQSMEGVPIASDLQLVHNAAERAMQTAVQEAVDRTIGEPNTQPPPPHPPLPPHSSLLPPPPHPPHPPPSPPTSTSSLRPSTTRSFSEGITAGTYEERSQPVAHSLPSSSSDHSNHHTNELRAAAEDDSVLDQLRTPPHSPLAESVTESLSPRQRAAPRSCDRSPDHSYRRSRFRVQRHRNDRGEEKDDENKRGEGEGGGGEETEEEIVDEVKKKHTFSSASRSPLQPFMVYKGHRNSRTMIKQANFLGENWILSGSDCGRVFVWDKWTGEVVNMFTADSYVVNCVQPHPSAYLIATSGIDYNVKLWEPLAQSEATLPNLTEVVRINEQMLEESRNTITIPSSFLFRILAYLNRSGRLRPQQDQEEGEPPPGQ